MSEKPLRTKFDEVDWSDPYYVVSTHLDYLRRVSQEEYNSLCSWVLEGVIPDNETFRFLNAHNWLDKDSGLPKGVVVDLLSTTTLSGVSDEVDETLRPDIAG